MLKNNLKDTVVISAFQPIGMLWDPGKIKFKDSQKVISWMSLSIVCPRQECYQLPRTDLYSPQEVLKAKHDYMALCHIKVSSSVPYDDPWRSTCSQELLTWCLQWNERLQASADITTVSLTYRNYISENGIGLHSRLSICAPAGIEENEKKYIRNVWKRECVPV